ncbi:calmodulin-like protein 3 [Ricinus communis]|uniref:calmodulin-like protein 3 n=1 Tax=Ricinus communis TaxID=3988 RepID=UPI00077220D1|nr:calmodulin-like protein 3 [Ricinus communis]|eukprot:XP_015583372.1 calmodulin-like protein 3 [Ricinus communis]
MPTILLRIFLLYNLLNSFLLSLVPKKLVRFFVPSSWYNSNTHQANLLINQELQQQEEEEETLVVPSAARKRMDSTELKKVFQMFDTNGDGRITKEELNGSLENLGIFIPDKELSQMMETIDVNGDGGVDIEEFGALYQSIMDEKDEDEDMREAFNVFDQNGDGYITGDELRSVLASLGLKQGRTAEDCKKIIMKVDVDGDGMVDFKEFKQMMKGGVFTALSSCN